jgi:threonine synthase
MVAGWRCLVCGATVDIGESLVWRCPNASAADRHHELELIHDAAVVVPNDEPNPFVAHRAHLATDAHAAALGMTDAARHALVVDLDDRIAAVAGTGFRVTPYRRADALSEALGFSDRGGVWIKDETRNVAGSHKARHLFSTLLHLVATEQAGLATWDRDARPPLAIASCGNAALAAATLAAAVGWPIEVFVPVDANPAVVAMLHSLAAGVVTCSRSTDDPPGDPCVHRFREAVDAGAVPFGVQGPENAWCLDGGRTVGWEIAHQAARHGWSIDRTFVQVGGGAFAACLAEGLRMAGAASPLFAVQTQASAPLERAWTRSLQLGQASGAASVWSECMWPWEHVGRSAADGILDDETYDWLPVLAAMTATGGRPVVVGEADVLRADDLAQRHTVIDASPTGTAGLAGVLAMRDHIGDDEHVTVVFSGVRR